MIMKRNFQKSVRMSLKNKLKKMKHQLTEAVKPVHNHQGKETRTLRRLWTTVPNGILYMGSQMFKKKLHFQIQSKQVE